MNLDSSSQFSTRSIRRPRSDARRVRLVRVDRPERPCDGGGAGEVALGGGERVCGGGRLEEEEREEDKDFRPDSSAVGVRVHAERLEGREEDKDSGPACKEQLG